MKLRELVNLMTGGTHFVVQCGGVMTHFYDPADLLHDPTHADKLDREIWEIWHSPHLYQTMVIKIYSK